MTDEFIDRLAADLKPTPARALERRILLTFAAGFALTLLLAHPILGMLFARPFGGAFGGPMFWVKFGYTLSLGLFGFAALPVLTRPDGRIRWPFFGAGALVLTAAILGSLAWMRSDWSMPQLMGDTAMVCPWLITLTGLPILLALLAAMRRLAPRSPTWAGFTAGLVAGGFGAWTYAFYCGETGMMFMAVWYSLGIFVTALLGAIGGRLLLWW